MKSNKVIGMCMVLIAGLVFASLAVGALGVTPARKTFDFVSGSVETINLEILNNEHKDMRVAIFVEGDLAQHVLLSDSVLEIPSTESSGEISYVVTLPNELDRPGRREANIVIQELQPEKASSGVEIGATVSVVSQLWVNVPYPGKYLTSELKIAETGRADRVDFIAVASSFGTQKIVNAKATIDIFGPTNEKIATVESDSVSIDPGERIELPLVWGGDINPGKYLARLTIVYDGEVAESEKVFDVGSVDLELVDMYVNDFSLGDIAKFNILVESNWAETFEDVYAEIRINEEDGPEVATVKSASENILSLSKQELTAFWDTAGVNEGTYSMTVILHYEGLTVEKEVRAVVSLTSIEFDLFGGTGRATSPGGQGMSREAIYIVALVVLIGLNVFWFVFFRKRKKKK